MQGPCSGVTQRAVLVTDGWSARVIAKWLMHIKAIQANSNLEVYLITESGPTLVSI